MKRLLFVWLSLSVCTGAQTVPFELHHGFLIVSRCSVGDLRNLTAVVDTGVTETTLDLRIAKRLALAMRREDAIVGTRSAAVQAVSIPKIQFGPLHAEKLAGIAADLSSLTYEMGIRPDLLVGMDLLQLSKFVIDYKAKTMVFGELPLLKYSAPILAESRLLLLDAVVDGKSLRFQIDTGFNAILVYGGRLRSPPLEGLDSRNSAFGIPLKARPSYIRELKIGTWRAKGITAYVTDEAPSGDPGFDGLLGPAALGVRRLAFDFENHTVAWQ